MDIIKKHPLLIAVLAVVALKLYNDSKAKKRTHTGAPGAYPVSPSYGQPGYLSDDEINGYLS